MSNTRKSRKPRILILGPDWRPHEIRLFHHTMPDLMNGKMVALDKWNVPYDFTNWDSKKDNGWKKWLEFSRMILSFPPSERGLDWEFFSLADENHTPVAYPQICVIHNHTGKWRPRRVHVPDDHAVFLRDFYSCCYCGRPVIVRRHSGSNSDPDTATIDHIVPLSRWDKWATENKPSYSKENWKNKVTACRECNHKKGGRMNEEMGYVLKRKPLAPSWSMHQGARMAPEFLKESWLPFLYPDGERQT